MHPCGQASGTITRAGRQFRLWAKQTGGKPTTRRLARTDCLSVLLLMTILAQSLLAFVRGNLVTLALSSTRHRENLFWLKE